MDNNSLRLIIDTICLHVLVISSVNLQQNTHQQCYDIKHTKATNFLEVIICYNVYSTNNNYSTH